jgi:hypothetical protein
MQTHVMLKAVSDELLPLLDAARQQEWDQLTACGHGPLLEPSKGSQVVFVQLHRLESLTVGQLELITGLQGLAESQQTTRYAVAGLVNVLWVCCISH